MQLNNEWIKKVSEIVGENIYTDSSDIEPYSHDEYALASYNQDPAAVVKPGSEDEVARVVRLCAEMNVPVTPRGGGTGLSAGCVPARGGIILSLERLNRIIDADKSNHTITVQAGVTMSRLFEEVEAMSLYFPPHPGDEGAFVGGVAATNAGGARAVKYGTVKRFILGLQVVTGEGRIAEIGGKYIKSSTGYNLLGLMIGSEGTLGIITRVTLALLPPPGSIQSLVVPFETIEAAIGIVPLILKQGIIPCAVEFVEHEVIRCSERLLNKSWPTHEGKASLMIILDGNSEDEVLSSCETIAGIMEQNGALDVLLAEKKERQAEILEVRSMIYEALRPGTVELLDICVPRSEIAGHVRFIHELEQSCGITLPTYGHAADGNVHTHLMHRSVKDGIIGDELPEWEDVHKKVRSKLYNDAIKRKGIISGEHGIGLVKKDYLEQNLGEVNISLMRSIKQALDPHRILNPGKVISFTSTV